MASHRTAAALWGFGPRIEALPEVTIQSRRRPRRPSIVAHRSDLLGPRDRTRLGNVPVTTVPRTLLDLAGVLDCGELESASDEALRSGRVSAPTLLAYVNRSVFKRFAGSGSLRALVQDRVDLGIPESELETRMVRLLHTSGLPEPVRQHQVRLGQRRVRFDLAYPVQRVAIELQGRAPHWGRDRWQADHQRQNAVELGGWHVLGFTWWDVNEHPAYVVLTIGERLGLKPIRWR